MAESTSTAQEIMNASDKVWKVRYIVIGFAFILGGNEIASRMTMSQLQENVGTLVSTVSAQTITVNAITSDHIRTDSEVKKNRELAIIEGEETDRRFMEMLRRLEDAIARIQ